MANALNGSDRNILDSTNCVKLSSILESFNAPINEEQCWALCHQTIKTISTLIDKRPLYLLNGPSNLYINKDGFVHQKSFLESNDRKRLTPSLNKLIASIGATLFLALDYGLESQEERSLDPKLELLIDRLTCSTDDKEDENEDKESNDEGIERDSPEYEFGPLLIDGSNLVEQVLNVCNGRLGNAEAAETHYRAVCRALVAEAMELSSFLYKITSVTAELKNGAISMSNSGGHHHHHSTNSSDCADSGGALISLEGLRLADWARLWMQVIQELRQGVKLKKVSLTEKPSFEFELTPYEMLLDDIRSRRYKLNKVKVNGSSPSRVTKDAHDLILDFIRSRPPLVPVSNRKLPPPPVREPSLFEKLLDSIRQQPKLKVIPPESLNQRSSPIRLGRVREDNCDSTCNKNNNYEYNNNNVNNNNILLNNNNNNNNHCNKTSSSSSTSISLSISCSSTFTKNTSTTVKTASTKSSTSSSSSSSSAPITATTTTATTATTTGLPSKLSQQQQARSSKQPKYILQEDPESLQGPKKKLVKSNLTLKILLSIDDDDDDIIQIQYK